MKRGPVDQGDPNPALKRPTAPNATGGSTALVRLTDLYSNEAELNNDLRWGYEPGSTTRRRLEREAKDRVMAAEIARLQTEEGGGMTWNDAWNTAHGYPVETKQDDATDAKPSKTETEAQRRKREAREARDSSRYWERQERKEREHPA